VPDGLILLAVRPSYQRPRPPTKPRSASTRMTIRMIQSKLMRPLSLSSSVFPAAANL
jgi:hypothetical protein